MRTIKQSDGSEQIVVEINWAEAQVVIDFWKLCQRTFGSRFDKDPELRQVALETMIQSVKDLADN